MARSYFDSQETQKARLMLEKLTKEQAETLQTQWATATQNRGGLPPVLPPATFRR